MNLHIANSDGELCVFCQEIIEEGASIISTKGDHIAGCIKEGRSAHFECYLEALSLDVRAKAIAKRAAREAREEEY